MGAKTKGGGVLSLVLAVVAVAVMGGVGPAVDKVTDFLSGLAPELITAPDVQERLDLCRPGEPVSDEECNGLRFVVLDAEKMPFIATNIATAWDEGKPGLLTRGGNEVIGANRQAACGAFTPAYPAGSCDEYPFASSVEGGPGARLAEVPKRENSCQGGTLGGQYRSKGIKIGDQYGVILRNPGSRATVAYTGTDIAKEVAC